MLRLLLLVCCFGPIVISAERLNTVYEWKHVDYKWVNRQQRRDAIASGDYNYTRNVIIDVDQARDGRVFVTIARDEGVPVTLATVTKTKGKGGPLLQPYPNWSWANRKDCNGITGVYRIAIDHCDRLWVLDTGVIGHKRVCTPQLLAFDLHTDKLIKRVKIPSSISGSSETGRGLLVTPIVEAYGSRCQKTYVYMADTVGYGLVVYDGKQIWRLESKVYRPNPKATQFLIEGEMFKLNDGVLGMALAQDTGEKHRTLYFRPLSSFDMYLAQTSDLKESKNGHKVKYYRSKNVLPSQSVAQAFSSDGTLFFGLTSDTSIACWNRYKPADRNHIRVTVRDQKRLQFVSGVKVIPRYITGYDEELWVISNRYQKVMKGTMDFDQINFRVMKANTHELTMGTACEAPFFSSAEHSTQHASEYGHYSAVLDEKPKEASVAPSK